MYYQSATTPGMLSRQTCKMPSDNKSKISNEKQETADIGCTSFDAIDIEWHCMYTKKDQSNFKRLSSKL